MQLGWRNPEGNPGRARYQDIRLYARAIAADEAASLRGLRGGNPARPPAQWTTDQWHMVTEFYLNEVDPAYRRMQAK